MLEKIRIFSILFFVLVLYTINTTSIYAVGITIPNGWKVDINDYNLDIPGDVDNARTMEVSSGNINISGNWIN